MALPPASPRFSGFGVALLGTLGLHLEKRWRMLKMILTSGLTSLCSSSRLHVPARFVTGQHQEPAGDPERYARAQLPVTISGSTAAPGIPIGGLGGMLKRP